MSIALDTSVDGGHSAGSSLSYSHTTTGSNLIIFVSCGSVSGSTFTATYNGVSMTQMDTQTAGSITTALFFLKQTTSSGAVNFTAGAHTVQVNSSSSSVSAVSASYTGARGEASLDSTAAGTFGNPATTISLAVTTVADNSWAVGGGCAAAGGVVSGNGTTTVRQASGSTFGMYICDTNAVVHPAGGVTLKINCTSEKVTISGGSFDPPLSFASNPSETQATVDSEATNHGYVRTFSDTVAAQRDTIAEATNRFRVPTSKSSSTWTNTQKSL